MPRKAKLAYYANPAKAAVVDLDATQGATIGTDLFMADGSKATKASLLAYLGLSSGNSSGGSSGSSGAMAHRLLLGLTVGNDHPQYTRRDTLTTRGDLYARSATDVVRLALGTNKQVFRSNGTDPAWTTLSPVITLSTDLTGSVTLTDLESGTLAATIANNAVTDAKLRDSVALSVIGRSANSTGDPADIAAASDGGVLRRSGATLGFGDIPESSVTNLVTDLAGKVPVTRTLTAGTGLTGGGDLSADRTFNVGAGTGITVNADDVAITTNGVTNALFRQSAALTVVGRAANSTGNVADIAASADDQILRRTGSALDFGQLTVGMFPANVVTYAKIQQVSATSRILGRVTTGAGNVEEVTLSQLLDFVGSAANGDILYRSGGSWTRLPIGSSTNVLTVTGGLPVWAAASGGASGSNPTASVGLTAVNGSAGTFMRSDAAPPIDQGITPTWTSNHTYSATGASIGIKNDIGRVACRNSANTTVLDFGTVQSWLGSGSNVTDAALGANAALIIYSGGTATQRVNIRSGGAVTFPNLSTTASAANAFLDSGDSNNLLRSTSSRRYKKDIEDIPVDAVEASKRLRPIRYRSRAASDDPELYWYGLIAEEVAEVDPRLVHWAYEPNEVNEKPRKIIPDGANPKTLELTPDDPQPLKGKKVPDGVMYDRIVVLLLARVANLEARLGIDPSKVKTK